MRSVEWMKKYMADWDANVPKSKDAAGDARQRAEAVSRPGNGVSR
jgi:hypothetical protein